MIPIDCKAGDVVGRISEALYHIPSATRVPLDATTKIVTTHGRFGYCMNVLKGARIIFINDKIVPGKSVRRENPFYRWFVCAVLHEVAHAHWNHCDTDNPAEEKQAWDTAIEWYNRYAPEKHGLPEINKEEIDSTELVIKALWDSL